MNKTKVGSLRRPKKLTNPTQTDQDFKKNRKRLKLVK